MAGIPIFVLHMTCCLALSYYFLENLGAVINYLYMGTISVDYWKVYFSETSNAVFDYSVVLPNYPNIILWCFFLSIEWKCIYICPHPHAKAIFVSNRTDLHLLILHILCYTSCH